MSRLKREEWRTHPEFTNYEISDWGRVRRAKDSNPCGKYKTIDYKKERFVNRLYQHSDTVLYFFQFQTRKNKMFKSIDWFLKPLLVLVPKVWNAIIKMSILEIITFLI